MNYEEIREFLLAFEDFIKHAEVEELYHEMRSVNKMNIEKDIEEKASALEVTYDYYMMEFM